MAAAARDVRAVANAAGRPTIGVVRAEEAWHAAPAADAHRSARYRRRRLAVVLLLTVAAFLVALGTRSWPGASGAEDVQNGGAALIVVADGDTLWELVQPYAPAGMRPHAWVARIADINDVDARALRPGTVLRVPRHQPP